MQVRNVLPDIRQARRFLRICEAEGSSLAESAHLRGVSRLTLFMPAICPATSHGGRWNLWLRALDAAGMGYDY